MLDNLRRDLRQYRTLAALTYDQLEADPKQLQNLLAIGVDNTKLRENPVRLDQAFFFPTVNGWEDERVTVAGLDKIDFVVPMKGWEATIPYNMVNIDRPNAVGKLATAIPQIAIAYERKKAALIMNVFRKNPLANDGQNFFDTDHEHPASKGTYDNTLDLTSYFANADSPTFDEVKALIHAIRAAFTTNLSIQSEVINGEAATKNLHIFVHNSAHFTMFDRVRTQSSTLDPNEVVGSFSLWRDNKPTSGQENYVEACLSEPGGMRPAFLVNDKDPQLDAWETNEFGNGYVAVGMRGIYGVKPGYPQCCLQAQD